MRVWVSMVLAAIISRSRVITALFCTAKEGPTCEQAGKKSKEDKIEFLSSPLALFILFHQLLLSHDAELIPMHMHASEA
jgi:hypothetical protein